MKYLAPRWIHYRTENGRVTVRVDPRQAAPTSRAEGLRDPARIPGEEWWDEKCPRPQTETLLPW